jgi:hypothetical protein
MEPPAVPSLHKSRGLDKPIEYDNMKTILKLRPYLTTNARNKQLAIEAALYFLLCAVVFALFKDTIVQFYSF